VNESAVRADVIAVDGPSASGKSTVSRRVAEELGRIYVDSGSFYRGIAWAVLREGRRPDDAPAVAALLGRLDWRSSLRGRAVTFAIDGVDPSAGLRSAAVRDAVSDVAAIPAVRDFVTARLRETARLGPLVMEGRDIGTVVFPRAARKFYLDADAEERARRRWTDAAGPEGGGDVSDVRAALSRRDAKDAGRAIAPLRAAPDACAIDSTRMSIEDVVAFIVARARGTAP
jgi:cytidylate kinase